MKNLADFLIGKKILEEIDSPINGKLIVMQDITWGTHIIAGNITQSGGVAKKVWNTTLSKIKKQKPDINNCLILGLGGGSVANIINNNWENINITGVDIDPVIVELGKKYLDINNINNLNIIITDAYKYCNNNINKYDLICVDTYVGDKFPEKLEDIKFLNNIKKLLAKNGIVIFNRLYYGEKRLEANKFEKKLLNIFSNVKRIYPEANVMFVCKV